MKPQEARDMSDDELRARERELADELFHLRLRRATSQLPNPMKVRETRRDLARVKTVLNQRVAAPKRRPAKGEAGAEAPGRPTGSGGSGSAQGAKRPSTGRAPRRTK
jgi:large subunit ribosomal protein L29